MTNIVLFTTTRIQLEPFCAATHVRKNTVLLQQYYCLKIILIVGTKLLHYGLCTQGGTNSLRKFQKVCSEMLQFEMEALERAAKEPS